jgi:hypothetical protein
MCYIARAFPISFLYGTIRRSNRALLLSIMLLLFVVGCQIEVSATVRWLVQRSTTEWCVSDTETATMMRPRPTRAVEPWKESLMSYTTSLISLSLNKLEKFRVIVCLPLCVPTHYVTVSGPSLLCEVFFYLLISNQKTLYIHAFYRLMCGLDCQWARTGSIDTSLVYSVEGPTAL